MKATPKTKTSKHYIPISKTKNGQIFNPNDEIWIFNDISKKHIINFSVLQISQNIKYGLKRIFVWYLQNRAVQHPVNMYNRLKELIQFLFEHYNYDISIITSTHLINYRGTLDAQHEWYLGSLSGFLKKWYEMGYPGVSKDAYSYLNETKFKSNEKGRAVLTMDPYDGPFTDLELENIQSAINNSYANGNISQEDYLLIWLLMVYGSRPIQFAQMKVCDLLSGMVKDNSKEYIIRIPRVKNRKKPRSEFKERLLPPALVKVLFDYRDNIKKTFAGVLDNIEQSPLFPSEDQQRTGEFAYHKSSDTITDQVQKVIDSLNVTSERTGEKIHITPTRFRRTIGTRAAAEGHGELIIAEILDHTDTQNAGVYTQTTPEIIKRIDKAVALQIAPIAQAFAGVIFTDKSQAKRADDPSSDIIDPSIESESNSLGKCGSYGFCGLLAPLACYTCGSFQAWSDAPHEELLITLLKKREELLEITDHRIASVNDNIIFAVAQVVVECQNINARNILEVTQ
ncbi:site-specific integrase [Sulfurovum sp. XTW-4]|uniref:Site-specific integrase n=1 Tax=Sulfurovum xiamenensis TaxID=3019066 RepID=A0ABT7QSB8_9BACT|nr:site-specific integrase [Sulfurovum xiamenensis]MDM5263982.1 site-specific integrase [Sulfurovum xiamenensis]